MSKIFFIFLSYFLLLVNLFLFLTPQKALAVISCNEITTDPSPVTTNDRIIKELKIKTEGLAERGKYWVSINNQVVRTAKGGEDYRVIDGIITINNVNRNGDLNPLSSNQLTFQPKTYVVRVLQAGDVGQVKCAANLIVQQEKAGGKDNCTIEFLNEKFTSRDDLNYRLASLNTTDEKLKTILRRRGGPANGQEVKSSTGLSSFDRPKEDLLNGIVLGKLEEGGYYLEVAHPGELPGQLFGIGQKTLCFTTFDICPTCTRQQVAAGSGTLFTAPLPPCAGEIGAKGCPAVNTAVGVIPTDPAGLVGFLFKLILGLSGGIALILIIVGAYQMMTSQGNPERLQGAKETITSAIVGLLFIIFSLLLLEIIGVDILQIPGLGR